MLNTHVCSPGLIQLWDLLSRHQSLVVTIFVGQRIWGAVICFFLRLLKTLLYCRPQLNYMHLHVRSCRSPDSSAMWGYYLDRKLCILKKHATSCSFCGCSMSVMALILSLTGQCLFVAYIISKKSTCSFLYWFWSRPSFEFLCMRWSKEVSWSEYSSFSPQMIMPPAVTLWVIRSRPLYMSHFHYEGVGDQEFPDLSSSSLHQLW